MNAELLDFVRRALEKGLSRDQVAEALTRAGWSEPDIRAALGAFAEVDFPIPVPRPRPYLSAQEVFTYALLFTALYVSAFNLVALVFHFIDLAVAEPRFTDVPQGLRAYEAMRGNIAALIVAFPLFLLLFRANERGLVADPTKRESKPRKWLTYLTLFIAAAVLIGDLSGLVYRLLGGDLTIRFLLKVATVGVIAGGVFAYFLSDIRRGERA
ncbi:DUF5671 domain-containing protein [Phenylobacterium sp. LjRoot219]|uniref:DUF5671 domain-containing protein n=1 Tax=Phenylobacterium sp. LjRoot219 TaxID=3342283 RepID=UPI003ED14543